MRKLDGLCYAQVVHRRAGPGRCAVVWMDTNVSVVLSRKAKLELHLVLRGRGKER